MRMLNNGINTMKFIILFFATTLLLFSPALFSGCEKQNSVAMSDYTVPFNVPDSVDVVKIDFQKNEDIGKIDFEVYNSGALIYQVQIYNWLTRDVRTLHFVSNHLITFDCSFQPR